LASLVGHENRLDTRKRTQTDRRVARREHGQFEDHPTAIGRVLAGGRVDAVAGRGDPLDTPGSAAGCTGGDPEGEFESDVAVHTGPTISVRKNGEANYTFAGP